MTNGVSVTRAGLPDLPGCVAAQRARSALAMVLAGALISGTTPFAMAADAVEQQFEQITVTAKKIEQGIYDVPVAVSAFSVKELEARQADNLMDVGNFVPNLTITSFGAGNTSAQMPFIRGIGVQDHLIVIDPGVGVYIDGVYLGRQIGQNLDLNNIERLEVLRGPQGTLFGRNSIGGAINIISRKPGDEQTARFSVEGGSRTRLNGDFYLNSRLNDAVAVSASVAVKHRDGLGKFVNVPNAREDVGELFNTSGRLALSWTPTGRFSLLLSADGGNARDGLAPYRTFIIESPGNLAYDGGLRNSGEARDPYDNNTGQVNQVETTASSYGLSLTAQNVFTDNLTGRLIASYRSSRYTGGLDDDGQLVDFYSYPEHGNATQHSVEAQLNGKFAQLDFVTGLFFFDEDGANIQQPVTFAASPDGYFEQDQRTRYRSHQIGGAHVVEPQLAGAGIAGQHADHEKHQEQRRAEAQREQARQDARHHQCCAEKNGYADGIERRHGPSQITANTCNCILIVATLRRQPISAASDNLPGFSAFPVRSACRSDGVETALMGLCRIFESSFAE